MILYLYMAAEEVHLLDRFLENIKIQDSGGKAVSATGVMVPLNHAAGIG